jgi:hypothetical protein
MNVKTRCLKTKFGLQQNVMATRNLVTPVSLSVAESRVSGGGVRYHPVFWCRNFLKNDYLKERGRGRRMILRDSGMKSFQAYGNARGPCAVVGFSIY